MSHTRFVQFDVVSEGSDIAVQLSDVMRTIGSPDWRTTVITLSSNLLAIFNAYACTDAEAPPYMKSFVNLFDLECPTPDFYTDGVRIGLLFGMEVFREDPYLPKENRLPDFSCRVHYVPKEVL